MFGISLIRFILLPYCIAPMQETGLESELATLRQNMYYSRDIKSRVGVVW